AGSGKRVMTCDLSSITKSVARRVSAPTFILNFLKLMLPVRPSSRSSIQAKTSARRLKKRSSYARTAQSLLAKSPDGRRGMNDDNIGAALNEFADEYQVSDQIARGRDDCDRSGIGLDHSEPARAYRRPGPGDGKQGKGLLRRLVVFDSGRF